MIVKQIVPEHRYEHQIGYMLTGYLFRLQSPFGIHEKTKISLEVDGLDRDRNNTKCKTSTIVEAPASTKSFEAEIRLDCPLRSFENVANMAYKLEPVESHEDDIEAIEYEGYSEAINSGGTT